MIKRRKASKGLPLKYLKLARLQLVLAPLLEATQQFYDGPGTGAVRGEYLVRDE